MRKIKYYDSRTCTSQTQDYIYENEEEWEKYSKELGLTINPIEIAQPGDYVCTDNGLYVRMLHRREWIVNKARKVTTQFPFMIYVFYMYKDGNRRTKYFFYNPNDYKMTCGNPKSKSLTTSMAIVVNAMKEGMSYYNAYRMGYSQHKEAKDISNLMWKLAQNRTFIYALYENELTEGVNKEMAKTKTDFESMMSICAKILADEKEPYQLRLECLKTIDKYQDPNRKAVTVNMKNDISLDELDELQKNIENNRS